MLPLKKLVAISLPLSLSSLVALSVMSTGSVGPVQAAADSSVQESPAQLRLAALDTLMKGDKHNALALYEEAIRLANKQFGEDSTFLGDLYYETGRLYLDLDQFTQADAALKKAVAVNPKNASARLALAKLLDLQEKVQDSIAQTREALMINPASPVARQKFIQTLSKYGQSPSDKSIVTQESLTIAMMQKAARLTLPKPAGAGEKPQEAAKKASDKKVATPPRTVPVLPKNLAPAKETTDAAGDKKNDTADETTVGAVSAPAHEAKPETKPASEGKSSTALTLFPLKGLSERKHQDELKKKQQEEQKKQQEEAARKKAEDAQRKQKEADLIEKIKEQARRKERAKAAEKASPAPSTPAPRAEKPAKSDKTDKAKAADSKGKAESSTPAKQSPAAQQIQQMPPIQMQPVQQFFMPPGAYTVPTAATQSKPKKAGFVPPPPPTTMPMYPMPVQVIPPPVTQAPKPAAEKPKVEKPKPAPKEEKQVEDKPPPMTTTGEAADPDFLLDWGDQPKNKLQKKKAK
ncbi:MAG: hypothetical protein JSS83_12930 [Cyanobacteria bacterium SZAS LIN-3]|nr:hypothetical protein [Cyanobacteria bacterium SZAS LIN-3]